MISAFFLDAEAGSRFCLYHTPSGPCSGAVLYVHPFAEEMNKARRMASLQARRLADSGFAVLLIDLFGCGDSSGEFGEARWDVWLRDIRTAAEWLRSQVPAPLSLWGLRLGASLAAQAAADPAMRIEQLVLWQPVIDGEQFVSQFLRLRVAGEMLAAGASTTAVSGLRAELSRGHALEIAGYELHPDLAGAIDKVNLAATAPAVKRVHWLELGPQPATLRPASRRTVRGWESTGGRVNTVTVPGEAFWSTVEITECPALLCATAEAMRCPA